MGNHSRALCEKFLMATPKDNEKIPYPVTLQISPSKKEAMDKIFLDPEIKVEITAVAPSGNRTVVTRALPCGPDKTDLVSAIIVTRASRLEFLAKALKCFGDQTHPYREAIIVTDDPLELPTDIHTQLKANVKLVLAEKGTSLGVLRNLGIAHSSGAFTIQWDDDDWYHPTRIALQLATLKDHPQADACTLERWTLAWITKRRYATSSKRPWEGSILARRWRLPAYPALPIHEDHLVHKLKIVSLDRPDLYTYTFHGQNAYDEEHFASLFNAPGSSEISDPEAIRELEANLGISHIAPATTPSAPTHKRRSIAFVYHPRFSPKPFDPENLLISRRGLTGSEKALFLYARELARLGHSVTVFAYFVECIPQKDRWSGDWGHVKCVQYSALEDGSRATNGFDVAIAVNHPLTLKYFPKALKIFNQQVNDFVYCPEWEETVDVLTSPSYRHLQHLRSITDFGSCEILPNGCDPRYLTEKITGKIIHASSPDRGLHHLLSLFPALKKTSTIPLSLDIYYELQQLIDRHSPSTDGAVSLRMKQIATLMAHMKNDTSVNFHGQRSVNETLTAFGKASFMLYPCDTVSFTEGFSVSTLEAAQAGALPIITGVDALAEIYGNFLPVAPAPYTEHHGQYFEMCQRFINDPAAYAHAVSKARAGSTDFYWADLVHKLVEIIEA